MLTKHDICEVVLSVMAGLLVAAVILWFCGFLDRGGLILTEFTDWLLGK
ncbi:MAG: hypothetical protein JSU70_07730 [Phycisphaerales bacterium]|nr:MAG: hypothetical protein JSU70_07730 [Phycisphaerales bacterium]